MASHLNGQKAPLGTWGTKTGRDAINGLSGYFFLSRAYGRELKTKSTFSVAIVTVTFVTC